MFVLPVVNDAIIILSLSGSHPLSEFGLFFPKMIVTSAECFVPSLPAKCAHQCDPFLLSRLNPVGFFMAYTSASLLQIEHTCDFLALVPGENIPIRIDTFKEVVTRQ